MFKQDSAGHLVQTGPFLCGGELHLELNDSALQDISAGPQTGSVTETFGFV